MISRSIDLTVCKSSVGTACLLTVDGVLDSGTYLTLRDSIIKAAVDGATAVLVDITALEVPAPSACAVFTSARWHVRTWPDVPVVLVCADAGLRGTIARSGVARYVPILPTVDEALHTMTSDRQPRRRAHANLPAEPHSTHRSRELVTDWLRAWSADRLIPDAQLIVTALVENVLQHTDSAPVVRAEFGDGFVTIAVQDGNSTPPMRRETVAGDASSVSGLDVVSALSRTWASTPSPNGKTVWAVIGPDDELDGA